MAAGSLGALTAAQQRYLTEIRQAGPKGRTYNGRARRVIEALEGAGLVTVTWDRRMQAKGNGSQLVERITVAALATDAEPGAGLMATFSRGRCGCGGKLQWVDDSWYCPRCGDEHHDEALRANHELAAGHRIYRYWDAGTQMDLQPLTVVRANRLTVTVDTERGDRFRLPYADVAGYYDEDD